MLSPLLIQQVLLLILPTAKKKWSGPHLHAVVLAVGKEKEVVSIHGDKGRTGHVGVANEAARPPCLELEFVAGVRGDDSPVHVRVNQSAIGLLSHTYGKEKKKS